MTVKIIIHTTSGVLIYCMDTDDFEFEEHGNSSSTLKSAIKWVMETVRIGFLPIHKDPHSGYEYICPKKPQSYIDINYGQIVCIKASILENN